VRDQLLSFCGSDDPLQVILRGGSVTRYHQEQPELRQSVAQHTWGVCVILLHLWPSVTPETLYAALYHDVAEGFIGDVPAPVKRALPEGIEGLERAFMEHLKLPYDGDLMQSNLAKLKVADYAELCIHCDRFPGRRARQIKETGLLYARKALAQVWEPEQPVAEELLGRIERGGWHD
jgi:hypothetical protein